MSGTSSYSHLFIALLAMLLLLAFPLAYEATSFRLAMAIKVCGLGIVAMLMLVWLFAS